MGDISVFRNSQESASGNSLDSGLKSSINHVITVETRSRTSTFTTNEIEPNQLSPKSPHRLSQAPIHTENMTQPKKLEYDENAALRSKVASLERIIKDQQEEIESQTGLESHLMERKHRLSSTIRDLDFEIEKLREENIQLTYYRNEYYSLRNDNNMLKNQTQDGGKPQPQSENLDNDLQEENNALKLKLQNMQLTWKHLRMGLDID